MTPAIKAIVVDPTKRTVEEVMLPTTPAPPGSSAGAQVRAEEFARILGCQGLDGIYLDEGVMLTLGDEPISERAADFWEYGLDCRPIPGVGVITGHDAGKDHVFDSPISLEEVRAKVIFTGHVMRGETVDEG